MRVDQRTKPPARSHTAVFRLIGLVSFFLLCARIPAQAPNQLSDNSPYVVDAWTTEDGLPQNSILSMAQTPDGYLWLGTFNGLVRFDGFRFTVYNPINTPALGSPRVLTVEVDKNGWLWTEGEDGSIARVVDGKFESMNGKMGLPNIPLYANGFDPSMQVRFGERDVRLYAQTDKGFVSAPEAALTTQNFRDVVAAARSLWLPMADGGWAAVNKDRDFVTLLQKVYTDEAFGGVSDNPVLPIHAHDGDTWVVRPHLAMKLKSGQIRRFPQGIVLDHTTDGVEDSEGNLLIGTWNQGAMILAPDGSMQKVPLRGGHSALAVRTVLIDREGNPWFGTDLVGLQRLRRRTFRTYLGAEKPNGDVIRSVTIDGAGRLWRVTPDSTEIMEQEGEFKKIRNEPVTWWTAAAAKDGNVWAGSISSGLCRHEGLKPGPYWQVRSVRVLAPVQARPDAMWVGCEDGLWLAATNSLEQIVLPRGVTNCIVRALLDTGDSLWMGVIGRGLWRKTKEDWDNFSVNNGLADPQVVSLYRDADQDLWVGTIFGGLHRFRNGRFQGFKKAGPRMPEAVLCIIEDDIGYLWMGSFNGVYRVSRKQLNAVADGADDELIVQHYDRRDGLATVEMSDTRQPTVCKTADGRLWFATINGLSVVNPVSVPSNPNPPPVNIEEVLVNGKPLERTSKALEIPPLSQRLEIRYTGVSLTDGPRVRFKYRLIGLQDEWLDVGNQRVATYYNLGPGSYRFEVVAANEDGVWNPRPVSLAVYAHPAWFQAIWFRASLGLMFLGAIIGAFQYRLRRAARAQAAREAFSQQLIELQEQERRRISLELHDGLGQTLLIAKHQANRAARSAGLPHEAVEDIMRVSQATQSAIDEVRTIVSALRPAMLDSIGLSGALSAMLQQVAQSGELKLQWKVADMHGAIPVGREIELFRVVQEALNNILKHSNAANARVDLHREAARWILEIEDDGRGFAEPMPAQIPLKPGGFGLKGIRERIRILRGTLTIDSRPGEGTLLRAEGPIRQ